MMGRLPVSVYLLVRVRARARTHTHTHTCAFMLVTGVCCLPIACPYILNFKSQECLLYIVLTVLCGNISGGLRGQGWYSKFRRQNLKGGGSHEQRKPTGLQGTPRGGPGAQSKEAWDMLGMSPQSTGKLTFPHVK